MVKALPYWPHDWRGRDGKPSTRRREKVHVSYSCGETSPRPDDNGPALGDAKSVLFLRRFEPSGHDRACLVRLYFARLARFLPAVLPGTTECAELVANGLGLRALGFLASRLLRFWLLAMFILYGGW